MLQSLIQNAANGALVGGIYASVAVGLTLIFGLARIVNFAHGAFVTLSAYIAWYLASRYGINPYLAGTVVVPIFYLIGVAYHKTLLERVVGRPLFSQALLTFGVALIVQSSILGLFGSATRAVSGPYTVAALRFAGVSLPMTRLIAFGLALAASVALYFLLYRTDFGIEVRAAVADREVAGLVGIDTKKVQAKVTGLGIALTGMGGVALMPILSASPEMSHELTFISFLIIIMGGLGSFMGALVSGVIIGMVEGVGAGLYDGSIARLLIFVVFAVVILVWPRGLFASRTL